MLGPHWGHGVRKLFYTSVPLPVPSPMPRAPFCLEALSCSFFCVPMALLTLLFIPPILYYLYLILPKKIGSLFKTQNLSTTSVSEVWCPWPLRGCPLLDGRDHTFHSLPFSCAGTRLTPDRHSREVSWMGSEDMRHKWVRKAQGNGPKCRQCGHFFTRMCKPTKNVR